MISSFCFHSWTTWPPLGSSQHPLSPSLSPHPSLLCMYLSIVRQMRAPFVLPLTLLQGLCLGMREPQPIPTAAHGSTWHLVSISRLWAIGPWQCCIVLPSKYEQYGPTGVPLTAYSLLSLPWCGGTWSAGLLSLRTHTQTRASAWTHRPSPVVLLRRVGTWHSDSI